MVFIWKQGERQMFRFMKTGISVWIVVLVEVVFFEILLLQVMEVSFCLVEGGIIYQLGGRFLVFEVEVEASEFVGEEG